MEQVWRGAYEALIKRQRATEAAHQSLVEMEAFLDSRRKVK
jgi:hypothetical protein